MLGAKKSRSRSNLESVDPRVREDDGRNVEISHFVRNDETGVRRGF